MLQLPYSIFLVLENTSQLWCIYFSFHCLGFSQTGGTLNLPVRRSLCINASSDLCSQTLIYWLSRTRVPPPPRNSETKPSHFHKRSLLQNIHDSGVQPESFMIRSVRLMFDVLPPLALCAYIMWTWMTAPHIFTQLLKCTKCINQEHQKPFCYQYTNTNNYNKL